LRGVLRWLRRADVPTATRVAAESAIKALIDKSNDILADWADLLTDRGRLAPFVEHGILSPRQIDTIIERTKSQMDGFDADPDSGPSVSTLDGLDIDEGSLAGRLDLEDDPLLLRLTQLKRGGLVAPGENAIIYQHVAIDEAQDRSAVEVKVLLEATARNKEKADGRSVTIAGDTAQRLVFDNAFTGWGEMLSQMGEACVVRPLKLSYRSTAEVMQISRDVLGPDLAPEEALTARSGAPVELHEFGDAGEAVAFLADALRNLVNVERSASACVISRYPEQADIYYGGLKRAEVPSLRRIRRHDFSFAPGVDVTDITQVKGLEFDYVVMVDVNKSTYPDNTEMRHLLHIGMTRAAHQLWIITTDAPSPVLPQSLIDAPLG